MWKPIETAPKDGRAVLLLTVPYENDCGPNGTYHIGAKIAMGHWFAKGTSWVPEGPPDADAKESDHTYILAETGVWFSGGGWFQPDEVSHWMDLPAIPETTKETI